MATTDTPPTASILEALLAEYEDMSPQVRLAAQYVLENPGEIAVTSMRSLADAADVKPNTLVRLARSVGFDGYEDFREPFRKEAADPAPSFPDRARWLRSINEGGRHGALLTDMAAATLTNIEELFGDIDVDELKQAADLIGASRITNVLGVGTARALTENFTYVARMALDNIVAIPTTGLAVDDVARMTPDDVLLAMTFSPYRTEIVDAVQMAVESGVAVVAVSDRRTAPISINASHAFTVPTDSPYPFSSNVAATALLETLLAFVVADSDTDVVAAIDSFHRTRHRAGIYTT